MKCLRCEAATQVIESRPWRGLFTRRMHECFNGHRFPTVEVPPGALDRRRLTAIARGVAARKQAEKLRAAVARQPGMSGEALGRALGVSGQRVRQIRREQQHA